MKRSKRVLLMAFALCIVVVSAFTMACSNRSTPATPTYTVTYAFGSYESTPYAGTSTLPTETNKEQGAKFTLAAAPVWEGYSFLGWNDGTELYDAGAQYTMPGAAVTLTATWGAPVETYAVTYAGGSCNDVPYAGTSKIPPETNKEEGEKFTLAAALVWEGYVFKKWSDGTKLYDAGAQYTMPAAAVTLTATWEATYAVTYALGRCNGIAYAGNSELPEEENKAKEAQFTLADAPVWEGHTFLGWNDGTNTYAAGKPYTMPAEAVTLTAQWSAYVELINYDIPTWNESATTGGYEIKRGQHVTISAILYKETDDSRYGINAKAFPNSVVDNTKTFYQYRPDFAVKRVNWEGWRDDNYGFAVEDGGWNSESYKQSDDGYSQVTIALSEEGILTYTFTYQATWMGEPMENGYSHTRVLTVKDDRMDSAYVIFGYDGASTQPSGARPSLSYPASDALTVTLDANCEDSDWSFPYGGAVRRYAVTKNGTFTLADYNPSRTGYEFLGWQVGGEGEYYKRSDAVAIGNDSVTLLAAWRQTVSFTYDKNGATQSGTFKDPSFRYDEATGKYVIGESTGGLPQINEYSFKKTGYRYDGVDASIDGGEPFKVTGPFSVDPGAVIAYKIRWAKTYSVNYAYGKCGDTSYGGSYKNPPKQDPAAEGDTFSLANALVWNGYVFKGWQDNYYNEIYQPGEEYVMPGQSVTFTAIWEKESDDTGTAARILQA